MREIHHNRDKALPTPRALSPGERLIDGRIYYSAAWLSEANEEELELAQRLCDLLAQLPPLKGGEAK